MTMNGAWGAMQGAAADTVRARDIVRMLGVVSAEGLTAREKEIAE